MKIHVFDGKQYIALGDLNHLRKNLIADIREKYQPGEGGQIHMTPEDVGQIGAYSHIMVEILKDELHMASVTATDPESLRKNHDEIYNRLRQEWMDGKFVIVAKDAETGETLYYRKMCGPDGDTPVFTSQKRLAMAYDDHYQASNILHHLNEQLGEESGLADLCVMPMYLAYMSEDEARKLLDAIFRDDDDCVDGVGQAFSPDAEEEGK